MVLLTLEDTQQQQLEVKQQDYYLEEQHHLLVLLQKNIMEVLGHLVTHLILQEVLFKVLVYNQQE